MIGLAFLLAMLQATPHADARPIRIASKPFAESYLLAEMFAQLLEARGFRVDRRLGLGATEIAFRALRGGAVDVYPEYTGTGLLAILGEPPQRDARAVFRHVAAVSRRVSTRTGCLRSVSRTPTRSRCGLRRRRHTGSAH